MSGNFVPTNNYENIPCQKQDSHITGLCCLNACKVELKSTLQALTALTTRMASAASSLISHFRIACQVLLAELSREAQKLSRPRLYLNA